MKQNGLASRWLDRPQVRPLRRALFQVHLWLGLLLGLYIVVISASGSAVVFRRELSIWLVPQFVPSAEGERLRGADLSAAIEREYAEAGYTVVRFGDSQNARPITVVVERDGESHGRFFDPYAAADMGESYPPAVRVMEWLVSLHDDLLGGFTGRKINGAAGALCVLLVVTGAVIWWPGRRQWKRSLYVAPSMRRKLWHLHSAIGFWSLALLFNWSLSGWYMGLPGPIESLKDWLDATPDDFDRPLDGFTYFITTAHFGRFGGLGVRTLWTVLGLLPALLFVTGFIVWWRRVVRPSYAALAKRRDVAGRAERANP